MYPKDGIASPIKGLEICLHARIPDPWAVCNLVIFRNRFEPDPERTQRGWLYSLLLEALVVFEGDVWRRRVDYESVSRTMYKEEKKRNAVLWSGVLYVPSSWFLINSLYFIRSYSVSSNTFSTDDFRHVGSMLFIRSSKCSCVCRDWNLDGWPLKVLKISLTFFESFEGTLLYIIRKEL